MNGLRWKVAVVMLIVAVALLLTTKFLGLLADGVFIVIVLYVVYNLFWKKPND